MYVTIYVTMYVTNSLTMYVTATKLPNISHSSPYAIKPINVEKRRISSRGLKEEVSIE
jgi:hypothetical protein